MPLINRAIVGGLCVLTAVISGYWALKLMMVLLVNGELLFGRPAIMLGASIQLLGSGIHSVVPQVRGAWFVLIAAAAPLVLCAVAFSNIPSTCWFFAFAVALCMGITQAISRALKRAEYEILITSLILGASWAPISFDMLHAYFSRSSSLPTPILAFLLGMWVLILESIVAGILLGKSPRGGE
jgi:hypothetical protein